MRTHRLFAPLLFVSLLAFSTPTDGSLLYHASLKNGDYGGGHKVGAWNGTGWNASGSTGGDLSQLGIVDSSSGVTYTTRHDVINFSLGADGKGGSRQGDFRTRGTVSVMFRADLAAFTGGQPIVDNYGFNRFRSGQGTFGTGLSRNAGSDGIVNTSDDRVEFGWTTWHGGVWYSHVDTANDEVLADFDRWHHLGLTWGGTTNPFEVWLDGQLVATDNRGLGAWGSSGLNSAYNFALGEIHERQYGDSSTTGITYANFRIWDEVRAYGDTTPGGGAVPEPSSLAIFGLIGVAATIGYRFRRKTQRPTKQEC